MTSDREKDDEFIEDAIEDVVARAKEKGWSPSRLLWTVYQIMVKHGIVALHVPERLDK